MKAVRKFLGKFKWKGLKLRGQMYLVYVLALIVPLFVIGTILVYNADKTLNEYYMRLLETDNARVKNVFSQVTTDAYNISNDLCYDRVQKTILSTEYEDTLDYIDFVNKNSEIDNIVYNYTQINSIDIYCDNPTINNYKQYNVVTDEIEKEEWYKQALSNPNAFWTNIESENAYGSAENNLALVRKIFLPDSDYNAVVVIKLGDNYIRSRIDSESIDAIALDDGGIVYSSKRSWYGQPLPVNVDYNDRYYGYSGIVEKNEVKYFTNISTTNLYMTNSKLYICTMNDSIYNEIKNIDTMLIVILGLAVMIPGVVLIAFTHIFTSRVYKLRKEMHKASVRDYDMIEEFSGHDELTEAYEDLKNMVNDIKIQEAKMYEAELNEKELRNNQQIMEYKMLASQINPHYLYNTLETIRMKALTMGNKEVADCIKILGKTLRYVLQNTGTTSTTLKKEIEHVENYLAIQKLRFGDRINYSLYIEEGLEPEKYVVLPLLLQPIVENAVIHGLENIDSNGHIDIRVCHNDFQELQITISDNGMGMQPEEFEKMQQKLNTPNLKLESSIGVYNICERIRLHYGEEYGLQLESEYGKGTKVILYLPVITSNF